MTDSPLLVWLRTDEPVDGTLLGGKAAALARLVSLDQPVPTAAVLTTAAYDAVAATPSIRSLVERSRGSCSDETADATPDEIDDDEIDDDEIDRTFLDAPVPDSVRTAIETLGAGLGHRAVVRSSATAEDLAGSAFAGQYRSVTDVEPDDLERAVRLVWASLWHRSPRTYRRLRRIDDGAVSMAVLVTTQIEPDVAGVLFTRDPVGDDSNVRLEIVSGSADALVSGAVTPEAHSWPRREAPAAAAAAYGAGGRDLVERGLTLETVWGVPLDIEFAIDHDGRLWLVQVRPVTTLSSAGTHESDLTRSGIAEMLPGVLPPLLQGTAGRHVDAGFRDLLADLGADLVETDDRPFVTFRRSRALLDRALLGRAIGTVPGGSAAAVGRAEGIRPTRPGAGESSHTSPVQVARVMRRRRTAVVASEILLQAADRLVADDGRCPDDDVTALLARWERVDDLGARATVAEMEVAALATAAHEGLQRTLDRYVGPERASELAQRLTTRPLTTRSGAGPLDRPVRACGADPSQPLCAATWDDVLARSGSRSVFGGPTWEDDPDLARMSCTVTPGDGTGRDGTGSDAAGDVLRSITRPAGSPGPRLTSVQRRFLRREAADAAELLDRRERTKRALLDLGGIAHRLTLALADRLAASAVLSSPDDIWLLTPTELRSACIVGEVPGDLGDRRATLAADRSIETAATSPTGSGHGWPASHGRARGRAVVVDVPRAGAIADGDVLVARSTDAGWAPLFAHAGAIVVEEGGPLSHAAIVARELGVPAVVNLPGIVERIRAAGGDVDVEVDGDTGAVVVDELPRPTSLLAPVVTPPDDVPRLGVFVTGLIGASALFGVVVSITEAVSSSRGIRHTRARAAIPAEIVADVVRHGTDAARHATPGLASSRRYGQWAIAMLVTGALLGALATTEYVAGDDGSRLVWLVTALSVVPAAVIGAAGAFAARRRWPDVPPLVRRLTPSPHPQTTVRQRWHEVPVFHRRWLTVFASTAVALLALNALAPTVLESVDEPLYGALGAPDTDPWGPDWFGMYFGRPQIVVPIALLVALFTLRCRVLAVAYPLTIMFGGLLNLGLGALVGKQRPPFGAHGDQTDSFPSGHAIEITLLLGLAPLAVAVLLRSRWFGYLVRVVASAVLIVMLVDGLRAGSHWPSDHLGGFAIAMTAVVFVDALARMPSLHGSCTNCPTMALRSRRGHGPALDGTDREKGVDR